MLNNYFIKSIQKKINDEFILFTFNFKELNKEFLNNNYLYNYFNENYPLLKFGEQTHIVNSIKIYNTDKKQEKWYAKIELNPNCIVSNLRNEITITDDKLLKECFNQLRKFFQQEVEMDIDYEQSTLHRIDLNLDIENILLNKDNGNAVFTTDCNVLYYYKPLIERILLSNSNNYNEYSSNFGEQKTKKICGFNNIKLKDCDLTIYDKGLQLYNNRYGILERDSIRFEVKFDSTEKISKHLKINNILDIELKELDILKKRFLYVNLIHNFIDKLIEETKDLQYKLYKNIVKGETYYFYNWLLENIDIIIAKKQIRHILNTFTHFTDQQKKDLMKTANYTIDNLGIYDEYKDTKKAYLKEINKTKYNNNLKLFNQILKSVNTSYNTDYTKALKGEHFNLELYLDKITIDED